MAHQTTYLLKELWRAGHSVGHADCCSLPHEMFGKEVNRTGFDAASFFVKDSDYAQAIPPGSA
ncbi:hypothetical protein, partial [Arthrobacter sp. SO3]|uniref:hypothetical protein n=1 Tax=Arthrobacter sp. SO3 TaxID=1897057 RepID=UPI001CFF8399